MQIVNTDEDNLHIFWKTLEFQWKFQERYDSDNIKSHKKSGPLPLSEKYIFWKNHKKGGGNFTFCVVWIKAQTT